MNELPYIYICIPAYKRIQFLQRLLNSIAIQTYTRYEVIVSDDSPDGSVENMINNYTGISKLHYYRNPVALGTPQNWNESISKAGGVWIKLMHDDDWFASPTSLAEFASATRSGKDFIFSAYENVNESNGAVEEVRASRLDRRLLDSPITLLARNLVGPPSVTLYKKTTLEFDKRMKWRVDIDFYIHYLKDHSFEYIDKPLIKVGISPEQVTQSSFLVPEVEIPENFLLLEKVGVRQLRNWLAYDSWWRLLRNLNIRSTDQIRTAGFSAEIPAPIKAMLKDQLHLSPRLLKWGVFSKICMLMSYFRRYNMMK
ncbi:MAG: glycosyltransferase family 2 protein [Chitinophagaceae bacterium]